MAGLQYRNRGSTSAGYSNGISSGLIANWTDTNLNDSRSATFYWDDSGHRSAGTNSRVYMTVTDSWTGRINADNSITLNVKSTFTMNRQVWNTNCPSYCTREIGVFTGSSANDTLIYRYSNESIVRGASHSGSRTWTITLAPGQERNVGSFYIINPTIGMCQFSSSRPTDWKCSSALYLDYISAGMMFRNTLPNAPKEPTMSLSCGIVNNTTQGNVVASVSDWGCPAGNSCSNSLTVQWATDSGFKNIVATGAGVKGLTPNTKYYVRATASNGHKSTTKTCNFTTLATSYPFGYKFMSDQVSKINVQINNGGNACDVSTKLYIKKSTDSDYKLITTTSSESQITETLRNLISRGNSYKAYTTTTNCAGTYTSPVYDFAPPAADSVTGEIKSTNTELDTSGLLVTVDYCYKVTSYTQEKVSDTNPILSRLEYRPEGQTDWVTTDFVSSTVNPDTICDKLVGLLCGVNYQFRTYQKIGSVESYSKVVTVAMPMCADVRSCVCDNLEYMTELICQELNRIKKGQKTIYANCPTKEVCDPYSSNPTYASILSRLVRFSQMVACLLCNASVLTAFSAGEPDQYYAATTPGEFGEWVNLSKEATEDSDNLISSDASYKAINTLLQSILRPIGVYDFFAESLDDLRSQTGVKKGDTAIVGDSVYVYGSSWTRQGDIPNLGDLGLVSISKGKWAQHEYYWWNGKWNLLNLNPSTEPRVVELEKNVARAVYNYDKSNEENMLVAPINYTDANLVTLAQSKYGTSREVTVYLTDGSLTGSPFILDISRLDGNDKLS